VQLTLDKAPLPIPFDQFQCARLVGWRGDTDAPGWRKVVASISDLIGAPAASSAPTVDAPLPLPGKPSMAVMPFANLSGDPEQDYFADGMVVDITNALSRFKSIFVIASGSTLSFKGKGMSPEAAAGRLGVRYVLEGSVRKAANRVRISVQLIDANDGAQVWTERFEDTLEDVFALQDKVALAVAGVIAPTVRDAEVRRASERPTDNPTSYDLYLRALGIPIIGSAAALQKSLELLDRAIALDPNYGPALSRAGLAYRNRYLFGWSDDPEHDRRQAVDLAHRALAATRDDADVLANAASVIGRLGGDPGAVVTLLDRALALNPGSSWTWFVSGRLRVIMGDAAVGGEHIEAALRLDPLSPARPSKLLSLGLARFAEGRFDEALALLQEAAQLRPDSWDIQFLLAACQGQLGEGLTAREALARARNLNPGLDVQTHAGQTLHDVAQRQLLLDGIALAAADGA
jgi:adenylate cyclase